MPLSTRLLKAISALGVAFLLLLANQSKVSLSSVARETATLQPATAGMRRTDLFDAHRNLVAPHRRPVYDQPTTIISSGLGQCFSGLSNRTRSIGCMPSSVWTIDSRSVCPSAAVLRVRVASGVTGVSWGTTGRLYLINLFGRQFLDLDGAKGLPCCHG